MSEYRTEKRGPRDWCVYRGGRYVGTITRFLFTERYEYRTSATMGRNYYDSLSEAERGLIAYDTFSIA